MSQKQNIEQLIDDFWKDTAALSEAMNEFVKKWEPHVGTLDDKKLTKKQLARMKAASEGFYESISKVNR